jgi:hypothetical protein
MEAAVKASQELFSLSTRFGLPGLVSLTRRFSAVEFDAQADPETV